MTTNRCLEVVSKFLFSVLHESFSIASRKERFETALTELGFVGRRDLFYTPTGIALSTLIMDSASQHTSSLNTHIFIFVSFMLLHYHTIPLRKCYSVDDSVRFNTN